MGLLEQQMQMEQATGGSMAPMQQQPMQMAPQQQQQEPLAAMDIEDASPAEEQEYIRATTAMSKVIYGTDGKTSDKIADALTEKNKIGSMIQATVMLIAQVDKQIDMDKIVMSQVAEDTVGMLAEVAEAKNGIQYSAQEMEDAIGGVMEALLYIAGGDSPIEPDYAEITADMGPEEISGMQQQYGQRVAAAKENQDLISRRPQGGMRG